jgi:hypothetical protein
MLWSKDKVPIESTNNALAKDEVTIETIPMIWFQTEVPIESIINALAQGLGSYREHNQCFALKLKFL